MSKSAFVLSIISISLSVLTVLTAAALYLSKKTVYIDGGC